MPTEHRESNRLNFEMEKIKSFLFVKNQKDLIDSIETLEKISDGLISKFVEKSHEVERLKRSETTLEGVIHTLKTNVTQKIERMEEETANIQIVRYSPLSRPPDRLQIYAEIEEDLNQLKARHALEQSEMNHKIVLLEMENTDLKSKVSEMHTKMTKKIVIENKGVQVTLDVEDKLHKNIDQIKAYYENVNYFVLGGKLRSIEWTTYLITDILGKKLLADIEDQKEK